MTENPRDGIEPLQYVDHFYINGDFIKPTGRAQRFVINPATEKSVGVISMGTEADVDSAATAARYALDSYGYSSREDRLALLRRILDRFDAHSEELARRITLEMGSPITFSREAQVAGSRAHIVEIIRTLEELDLEQQAGRTILAYEPIGVCSLITPWNFPIWQIVTKVMPALAAGCSIILKPSEYAPLSPILFAQILHEAGVPKGVFNLINGDGATVGNAMSRHRFVDMVSFTGSTRAGIQVAKNAADTIKRVHQELGGNSPNILLPGVDLEDSVPKGVLGAYRNAGQSCTAPMRMLVPSNLYGRAVEIAKAAAETVLVGDIFDEATTLGPLVNEKQLERVRALISSGIHEGARLLTGGADRPFGLESGYYVAPTVFADVSPSMTIAQEEIFGPVVSLIPYDGVDHAIEIANNTPYGLAAYLQTEDLALARRVASRVRAGQVLANYPEWDPAAPFGGYKQSGNGREYGKFGLEAFLEVKAIGGFVDA